MKHVTMLGIAVLVAGAPTETCPPTPDSSPEWSEELPDVGLVQGQVYSELDLDDFVTDGDNDTSELVFLIEGGGNGVAAAIDGTSHVLTLTAQRDAAGPYVFMVEVVDPEGNSADTQLDVFVHERRRCETVFTYDAREYGPVASISVAGQFNAWSPTATPLTNDGTGVYTATLNLDPGYYQYKFVRNGSEWIQDPANPLTAWDGGFENSEVHVPDCTLPLLSLETRDTGAGSFSVRIRYTDGAAGGFIDQDSLWVQFFSGAPVPSGAVSYDAYAHEIDVTVDAIAPGKHSIWVDVSDDQGRAAETLYVPLWVGSTTWDWRDANLYFAFTDRFDNGDTANDINVGGVPYQSNYQGGDLEGIRDKIDSGYFDNLGINAIWISPQLDNTNSAEYGVDGRLYSGYHGYWPASPSAVEPAFGDRQALKDLIAAAHEHGIRVMFDLVANHVHNQHPYYSQENISAGWFNPFSLCTEDDGWNQNPIGCWFAPYLPDIDYQNPDALHTMVGDALGYIEEFDIDGYRVDAVKHMENCYLYHLSTGISDRVEHGSTAAKDKFYLVGETFVGTWDWNCDGSASCPQALVNSFIGDRMLDGQFDFPLYWQIVMAFARNEVSLADLAYLLDQDEAYYGTSAIMSLFLGNHDVVRFISQANGDIPDLWGADAKEQGWTNPPSAPTSEVPYRKLQMAFTFLATIRGVPLVYYGDEIGMPGAGDPDNRRMMVFDDLSSWQQETLAHVQAVMRLRQDHASLRTGQRLPLLTDWEDVLVYGKAAGTDKAVVAFNRSGNSQVVNLDVGSMGLSGTLTDALSGATADVVGTTLTIELPPYSSAVFF